MVGPITVLHELQRRGFFPDPEGRDWATLHIGKDGVLSVPRGMVRAEWDDSVITVYAMTGNAVVLWDVRLSGNTPLNVITAVIDLAIAHVVTSETQAAERKLAGGVVAPLPVADLAELNPDLGPRELHRLRWLEHMLAEDDLQNGIEPD